MPERSIRKLQYGSGSDTRIDRGSYPNICASSDLSNTLGECLTESPIQVNPEKALNDYTTCLQDLTELLDLTHESLEYAESIIETVSESLVVRTVELKVSTNKKYRRDIYDKIEDRKRNLYNFASPFAQRRETRRPYQ